MSLAMSVLMIFTGVWLGQEGRKKDGFRKFSRAFRVGPTTLGVDNRA